MKINTENGLKRLKATPTMKHTLRMLKVQSFLATTGK